VSGGSINVHDLPNSNFRNEEDTAMIDEARVRSALIVDDSSVQRMHEVALLQELGVSEIYEACDGIDALRVLDSLPSAPDLFIIDLEMPNMDGIELLQQLALRKIKPGLIIASSKDVSLISSVRTMIDVFEMPVLGALQKPLTVPSLNEAVRRFVPATLTPGKQAQKFARVTLEQLTAAVAAGQVQPWFQPKIDLVSGEIKGVEALARWIDPEQGFIAPDRFIPVAESEGYIHELTVHLVSAACEQLSKWNELGLRLQLSMNLSPLHFSVSNLASELVNLVLAAKVEPQQVIWEVTESAASEDVGASLATLARLRLKGFGLSIDDYGTGFSSLQQLSRIPFSELKVDKSFVNGAHHRDDLRVILRSALDMAQQLKLSTVAEGVETVEDLRHIKSLGCEIGQGYLFGKAIPGADIPTWCVNNQTRITEIVASANGD
jgi:EAL domain-containing protein (putative c-di-GMP-specific phosphodiesterase class I)/DNA-binding NarL/FixJ family response regulator